MLVEGPPLHVWGTAFFWRSTWGWAVCTQLLVTILVKRHARNVSGTITHQRRPRGWAIYVQPLVTTLVEWHPHRVWRINSWRKIGGWTMYILKLLVTELVGLCRQVCGTIAYRRKTWSWVAFIIYEVEETWAQILLRLWDGVLAHESWPGSGLGWPAMCCWLVPLSFAQVLWELSTRRSLVTAGKFFYVDATPSLWWSF